MCHLRDVVQRQKQWNAHRHNRKHRANLEKLEQLRALENGMRIDVGIVGEVPFGVDTPEDLEKARRFCESAGA